MNSNNFSFRLFLCACFLFQSYSSQNVTELAQCEDNGLTPNDEYTDDSLFVSFSEKLEIYTGLNNTESFNITLEGCDGKVCVVNPQGNAIWDSRMDFYLDYMKGTQSNEADARTTLDGCLCYSKNISDYQTCMAFVRQQMIDQLETVLVANFKNILQSNCTLVNQNCVQA